MNVTQIKTANKSKNNESIPPRKVAPKFESEENPKKKVEKRDISTITKNFQVTLNFVEPKNVKDDVVPKKKIEKPNFVLPVKVGFIPRPAPRKNLNFNQSSKSQNSLILKSLPTIHDQQVKNLAKCTPSNIPRIVKKSSNSSSGKGSVDHKKCTHNAASKTVCKPANNERHRCRTCEQRAMSVHMEEFEQLKKNLSEAQSYFLQKLQSMKCISKNEFVLIAMIKNDDYEFIVKDDGLKKIPDKLPVKSTSFLKIKMQQILNNAYSTILEVLKNSTEKASKEVKHHLKNIRCQVEISQTRNTTDVNKWIELLCMSPNSEQSEQISKLMLDIQDYKRLLTVSERTIADLKRCHAEEIQLLVDKFNVMNSKHIHNSIMGPNENTIEEEKNFEIERAQYNADLKSLKDTISGLKKELIDAESLMNSEKIEKIGKQQLIRQLEAELDASNTIVEDLVASKTEMSQQIQKFNEEVKQLTKQIVDAEKLKFNLEIQISDLMVECCSLKATTAEVENYSKQIEILQLERLNDRKEINSKETEITTYKQLKTELLDEIEKLKVDLEKANANVIHLQEQVERGRQLVDVRNELMYTFELKTNVDPIGLRETCMQMNQMEILKPQIPFKKIPYNFTSSKAKLPEHTRQDHTINLLRERNEHSQVMRSKQEEQIRRMNEEINYLKDSITSYQKNFSGNHKHSNQEPEIVSTTKECTFI